MSRPPPLSRGALYVENITVPQDRLRKLDPAAVARLCDSMSRLGLRVPISVRVTGDDQVLVAGLHRLCAAEKLGWEKIEVVYCNGDEADARLWEIAENLHRCELNPVERAEHIAEWVRLTEAKRDEAVSAHDAPKLSARGRGGEGRPEGGINAASRELGIDRTTAQRAVKIAELPQETRDQAREEGWSQKRLLEATKPVPPAPTPRNDVETEEAWMTTGMRWWNKGSKEWREEFLARIEGGRHA